MTIYEDYKWEEEKLKQRHREEMGELLALLRTKQANCSHPSWTRHEDMFYAMGETAPGEMCNECGLKQHCERI